jgi:hypothetical protein
MQIRVQVIILSGMTTSLTFIHGLKLFLELCEVGNYVVVTIVSVTAFVTPAVLQTRR